MNILLNDLLLLFITLLFLLQTPLRYIGILMLLLALITAAASYLYPHSRWLSGLRMLCILAAMSNLEALFALPVVFYNADPLKQEKPILTVLCYFIPLLFHLSYGTLSILLLWLIAMCFALLLNQQTLQQTQLETDYKKQRDTSKELALVLEEQNKALLVQQEQEIHIATLNERNRIAREIHDNVGHLLSSALLQIGAMQAIFSQSEMQAPLRDLRATISTGMDSVRDSVHDLHDDALELESAIQDLLRQFTFCQTDFLYEILHPLPMEQIYHVLAIIKECMNNTMKHSNATRFSILMREQPGFYQLILEDNGTKTSSDKGGIGLKNIKDRVTSMRGYLNIRQDQGFCVFITIPKEDA